MVKRDDDLVGDLGGLPGADLADQGDVLAHQVEQRLDLGEIALRAADHDGQRRRLGADFAARDRRVDITAAFLGDLGGEFLGLDRRDRAHIDDDLARRQAVGDAAGIEQHALYIGRVGHHQDHDLGALGDLFQGVADGGAGFANIGRQPALAVHEKLVAALDQVEGHRMPHDPEPDKTDFHDPSLLFHLPIIWHAHCPVSPGLSSGVLGSARTLMC